MKSTFNGKQIFVDDLNLVQIAAKYAVNRFDVYKRYRAGGRTIPELVLTSRIKEMTDPKWEEIRIDGLSLIEASERLGISPYYIYIFYNRGARTCKDVLRLEDKRKHGTLPPKVKITNRNLFEPGKVFRLEKTPLRLHIDTVTRQTRRKYLTAHLMNKDGTPLEKTFTCEIRKEELHEIIYLEYQNYSYFITSNNARN